MATKKTTKDEDAPVLGTGAVGDPEQPAVGSPVEEPPADPADTPDARAKKSEKP